MTADAYDSFSAIDAAEWQALLDDLRDRLRECASLEQAAQRVAKTLFERFPRTTLLARVYGLVPYGELPGDVRTFVDTLAAGKAVALRMDTPTLALLGTYGVEEDWRDRRRSKGHAAIPLLSGAFVEAIPMVARLLKELGVDLAWLDDAPELNLRRLLGGFNGIFFVEDARTARDTLGRHVIPAQDFVEEHDIQSVFGMGGFYPDGRMVACIVFARERLARDQVASLKSLISVLKGETFGLVRTRRLFG